ncbi:MAG: aspartate-semialdehyde dehydrogenase [Planctomycetia bacterium]|uniref:Aspartate-semialdehyde dehydrogenase n=1 Tax=Candidatus Brocadia sapporoensis TaxID=392547 RepID=A0A1V6LWS5_9BACT|nr:aspartate-semialdehyde dehydrogenase [Candidatus Brocadia sapporoensis]MCC7238760.1 aspartate-semialdehyde dehydrogenase [Candidatus Brocadia sp.]QOJ07574.1 MAG: aspartate-semialdehyde dehydrogenase [Planctomycetia bacterium]TVL98440.1 MAG: aspartate-semialdehyde dehydrogenase [Candidatus Brocadia sp. BL1]MDG6004257.1 aspartate-semialdehyde dehydrogenase [Candidatus Brocadia sp.]OQD44592.1 aspartate-semialdehyde dehydrogenase [Candidatus Brocadia sapporoensis]
MAVNIAVVGATGAVGEEFLRILETRKFPIKELRLLASRRSAGKKMQFRGADYTVQELSKHSFQGIKIALFSAGASISREYVPYAIESGAVCVDNSSAFRMDDDVPLVVPEVNPQEIAKHHGVIANPNCSTIQMVVALKPIHDAARIKRIVVSTYQAVSGAGLKAIDELQKETMSVLSGKEGFKRYLFPHQIAFNVLPQIPQNNAFLSNGYTSEELKMINETKKIMGDNSIRVTATTVRVPVVRGHSESVNVETEKKITAAEVKRLFSKAPGVTLMDDPANQVYPLATNAVGKDDVFVGRIREDESIANGINLWVVSDNLRKGAALNAIQIAEMLLCQTAG